jgi:hypothetical protein
MSKGRINNRRWSALPVVPLLCACSADVVDLGGGARGLSGARGARCESSLVIAESVRVSSQAELEELRGCEEIQGDLRVDLFAGADLSPLVALRSVGGGLLLGGFPAPPRDEPWRPGMADEVEDVIEQGFLPSLHGLEALERVGEIAMSHVAVSDFSAFQSLRSVATQQNGSLPGQLLMEDAPNLTSLRGLENVSDIQMLLLNDNPLLESLDGLNVYGASMGAVAITNSARLSSLYELSLMSSMTVLALHATGVRNLDDLLNLEQVSALELVANPELENIDALGGLVTAESITVAQNPKLRRFPSMARMGGGLTQIMITRNAELETISLELTAGATSYVSRGKERESSAGFFEIGENPKLLTIGLAAGLAKADYLAVYQNPSLARIDFGSLQSLDTVSIDDNAALTTLIVGDLQTVDLLLVTDNPLLSMLPFASVRTFASELRGNADNAIASPSGAN